MVVPAPSPAAYVVSAGAMEAQATALRFDGRRRWVSASEGGLWSVQRAVVREFWWIFGW